MNLQNALTDFKEAIAKAKAAIPQVEAFLVKTEGAAADELQTAEVLAVKKLQTILSNPQMIQLIITLKAVETQLLNDISTDFPEKPADAPANPETVDSGAVSTTHNINSGNINTPRDERPNTAQAEENHEQVEEDQEEADKKPKSKKKSHFEGQIDNPE